MHPVSLWRGKVGPHLDSFPTLHSKSDWQMASCKPRQYRALHSFLKQKRIGLPAHFPILPFNSICTTLSVFPLSIFLAFLRPLFFNSSSANFQFPLALSSSIPILFWASGSGMLPSNKSPSALRWKEWLQFPTCLTEPLCSPTVHPPNKSTMPILLDC